MKDSIDKVCFCARRTRTTARRTSCPRGRPRRDSIAKKIPSPKKKKKKKKKSIFLNLILFMFISISIDFLNLFSLFLNFQFGLM